ncbi:hypothetical protein O181_053031 [Austropuccinia psidii MF-1]|uniref:CCHC-type domain-containing protein n=1 Tax=Austropuccinia psidii MF-1 TaxID=1389203 RepID=A0A9Q3DZN8_9BASI|nr:hypothetical protein [Austropuccinia psidii MF-1]
MCQYAEQTQKKLAELEARHVRMKKLTASMDQIVKLLPEGHAPGFKEKKPFRVEFTDKTSETVAVVAKKRNSYHNCGSTDHYSNNCPKAKKKVYAIEKLPEEESPTENSDSDSMGDSIREQSDEEQDPREEFLVE